MSDLPSPEDMEEIAGGGAPLGPEVAVCETFPRDGLAQEAGSLPSEAVIALIERIIDCGFRRIAIGGFAGAEPVLRGLRRRPGVALGMACPEPQAARIALAAQDAGWAPEALLLPVSASEAHSQRHLGRGRADQWAAVAEMAALLGGRFALSGSVAAAFDCPFHGPTDPERVLEDARRFAELGVTRIVIEDGIGSATPPRVRDLIGWLHGALPTATFVAHFHDSRGTGIANTLAAIEAGLTHVETALGGAGSTCTEDLVMAAEAMGIATGLDPAVLRQAGREAERLLGRPLHSRTLRLEES